jgi:hypothetical protein
MQSQQRKDEHFFVHGRIASHVKQRPSQALKPDGIGF